jgi:quinol-cytochrome oxidoreductase complex cytochrome b subunit
MKVVDPERVFPKDPDKTYGLMELVKGTGPGVGRKPEAEDYVFTWPHVLYRELALFALVGGALLIAAVFINAPLEEMADPTHPPNPAKAPWYFLGLQEMVSYSAFVGGVLVPTLIVLVLLVLPWFDRKKAGIGIWFARERIWANTFFLAFLIVMLILIVLGTWFRGPNWDLVVPWESHPGH